MALTPRPHGITNLQAAARGVTLMIEPFSIWGVVCFAPDADADAFPLNSPVLITDPQGALADAGATGTLASTLLAIGSFGASTGVVVRVEEGAGETEAEKTAATNANVIAGLQKLRLAEQVVKVQPRILAAPGLDTQPVTVILAQIAASMSAFAYAASQGDTPALVKTYRDGFTARELMLIDRDWLAVNPATALEELSFATAQAVGLRASLDRTVGYHKTISNVLLVSPTGIKDPRPWDLSVSDTEMGLINGADVTGLIWRGGPRFWGNRTCSTDPRYAFESAVRTNQVLRDTITEGLFPYIDQPLVGSIPTDIIESINALGRREVTAGRIQGFTAFLANDNSAATLSAGKLKIGYRFTPAAPLEHLTVVSEITDEFYADFAQLAA